MQLANQVIDPKLYPTPNVQDAIHPGRVLSKPGQQASLAAVVNTGQSGADLKRRGTFATPTASPWRSGHASEETHDRNSRPLNEQIVAMEGSGTETQRMAGSLNPEWVGWLMGFPPGWTHLELSG